MGVRRGQDRGAQRVSLPDVRAVTIEEGGTQESRRHDLRREVLSAQAAVGVCGAEPAIPAQPAAGVCGAEPAILAQPGLAPSRPFQPSRRPGCVAQQVPSERCGWGPQSSLGMMASDVP